MEEKMIEIFLQPEEVWDYFLDNEDKLRGCDRLIARNGTVEIWMASYRNVFEVSVTEFDDVLDTAICTSKAEADEFITLMYESFIYESDETEDRWDFRSEVEIEERESEIDDAIVWLIDVLFRDKGVSQQCDLEQVKDNIIATIAASVDSYTRGELYRPSYIKDENGNLEYIEYPYEI